MSHMSGLIWDYHMDNYDWSLLLMSHINGITLVMVLA